jgi:hypothetical protein
LRIDFDYSPIIYNDLALFMADIRSFPDYFRCTLVHFYSIKNLKGLQAARKSKENAMNNTDQTTRKDDNGGVASMLRSSLKTGLGVAEHMHQFAVEIPLNMLTVVGVSEEQTSALKDKHRNLLRGMYGSIDSVASQMTEVGERQAALLADGIRDLADDNKAAAKAEPTKAAKDEESVVS